MRICIYSKLTNESPDNDISIAAHEVAVECTRAQTKWLLVFKYSLMTTTEHSNTLFLFGYEVSQAVVND